MKKLFLMTFLALMFTGSVKADGGSVHECIMMCKTSLNPMKCIKLCAQE